jgi:2-keto-4-pentenoate hydratase/2-oxohepta-3-ene-1,7-dioic acid hydratase in catechol pathway
MTFYALGTFSRGDQPPFPAVIRDEQVLPLAQLLRDAPASLGAAFANWQQFGPQIDAAMASLPATGWRPESELAVHLPFMPGQLFGAGANYRKHVIDIIVAKGTGGAENLSPEERRLWGTEFMDRRAATGLPFIWVGLNGAIAGSHDTLILPRDVTQPDWELELAVVIGKAARRVAMADALDHVAGYTIANDVTARELVDRPDIPQMGMDWMRCKNAPGFNILGPYITPARFVPDPQKLHIKLSLNGQVMQDEGTDDMIFSVARLIEFASAHTQLNLGDIIMTGSPSGNGIHHGRLLQDGDVMTGEIVGLVGRQVTPCKAEK